MRAFGARPRTHAHARAAHLSLLNSNIKEDFENKQDALDLLLEHWISENSEINNIQAFEIFMTTKEYDILSSGEFHDKWFLELEKNKFIVENPFEIVSFENEEVGLVLF